MATAEYQGKPVAPDVPLTSTKPLDYVKAVAAAHGLDWRTLWGVMGAESDYGQDPNSKKPNSAGALGPFQFLAATWRKYGSSNPNDRLNFGASANAAARYLHALGADNNIDSPATAHALAQYNGARPGSADAASYVAKVKTKGSDTQDRPVFDVPVLGTVDPKKAVQGLEDAAKVPGEFLNLIKNPQNWLRLIEMALGLALLLMGLKSFTGGAIDPVGAATRVAARAV
jgi:hypothetical protein